MSMFLSTVALVAFVLSLTLFVASIVIFFQLDVRGAMRFLKNKQVDSPEMSVVSHVARVPGHSGSTPLANLEQEGKVPAAQGAEAEASEDDADVDATIDNQEAADGSAPGSTSGPLADVGDEDVAAFEDGGFEESEKPTGILYEEETEKPTEILTEESLAQILKNSSVAQAEEPVFRFTVVVDIVVTHTEETVERDW